MWLTRRIGSTRLAEQPAQPDHCRGPAEHPAEAVAVGGRVRSGRPRAVVALVGHFCHLALPGPALGGPAVLKGPVGLTGGDLIGDGAALLISLGKEVGVIDGGHDDSCSNTVTDGRSGCRKGASGAGGLM